MTSFQSVGMGFLRGLSHGKYKPKPNLPSPQRANPHIAQIAQKTNPSRDPVTRESGHPNFGRPFSACDRSFTLAAPRVGLREGFPLLTQASHGVASQLIRNYGTLGGNINQRPRCWFLRGKDFNCYKKGGDFCFTVGGDNRYHAIIGGELCYIVHPSDTATALLALNAQAKIAGPGGERMVPFDNYFIGPREDVLRENILKPEELLVEVFIPAPAQGTKQAWMKLKNRQVLRLCHRCGGRRLHRGERHLEGRPHRAGRGEGKNIRSSIKQAAAAIRTVARPMSMNAYKVDVAQSMLERTVLAALG